jgi:alpha-N-arabinofuranosidase
MARGGVRDGRLAVTELQMFAHLRAGPGGQENGRLAPLNLVTPPTLAEALYDTLIYHSAVRLQPFVELVTHSATVNHGGGLRKEHERVYPNPCYYANLLFAEFAGARAAKSELRCPSEQAPLILPDIKNAGGSNSFDALDAVAAIGADGDLLLSIVHRGTAGPIRVTIRLDGFSSVAKAQLSTITGPTPWAANTLKDPAAIQLARAETELSGNSLTLLLHPYSVVQARVVAQR